METVQFSVVVPTFNRNDILPETLSCLADQTIGSSALEVIVIDDAHSAETEALVRRYEGRFHSLRYLAQDNEGQSKARNRGISIAAADLVFLMGDDILLRPDVLEKHLAFHTSCTYDNVAALGRIEFDPRTTKDPFLAWLAATGIQNDFSQLEEGYIGPEAVEAAHLSIKKKYAQRVPFEERLRYYENFMWAQALFRTGFLFYYLSGAISYHFHPTSCEEYGRRMHEIGKTARQLAQEGVHYFVRRTQTARPVRKTKLLKHRILARVTGKEKYRQKYWKYYLWDRYYRGVHTIG